MTALPTNTAAGSTLAGRPRSVTSRRLADRAFLVVCLAVTSLASLVLAILLIAIFSKGWGHLGTDFLSNYPSRFAEKAGFKAALWGSVWTCIVCAAVAIPLGVGTAVLLEEYAPKQRTLRRLHEFIQLNISNLAGVPSVVYGIIGLTAFARMFGLFGPANLSNYDDILTITLKNNTTLVGTSLGEDESTIVLDDLKTGEQTINRSDIASQTAQYVRTHHFLLKDGTTVEGRLSGTTPKTIKVFNTAADRDRSATRIVEVPRAEITNYNAIAMIEVGGRDRPWYFHIPFGGGVLAAGLTLMLVVLPIVIVSTREALRSVPPSLREGAMALGATKWQTVSRMVLPAAVPGIMTGAILAMSRAIGEAAPILVVSGIVFIMNTPKSLMSDFSAMPLQIYSWANMPQDEFKQVAAAGIIVLLVVLSAFNLTAVIIRQRFQRGLQ
jgi:phosphate transport system permease protein